MNVYREIALFFDEPFKQVVGKCRQAHFRLHRSWREMSPVSEKHRMIWYRTTDSQIYEEANWHGSHLEKRKKIAKMAKGEILCFGAGIGTEGLMAAEMGKNVTFYDLQGLTFDFLKFRVSLRGLKSVKFINSELSPRVTRRGIYYVNPEFKKYDTIICIDVLEHADHPQEILNFLGKHLKKNGLFLVSAPFASKEYLPHLEKNYSLDINVMMRQAGIKKYKNDVLGSEIPKKEIFGPLIRKAQEIYFNFKFCFNLE